MRKSLPLLLLVFLFGSLSAFAGDKMSPEDLIAKHLDAIGKADARAAAKGRFSKGTAQRDILTHGSGHLNGTAELVSRESDFQYVTDFQSPDYLGEQITLDHGKPSIASNGVTQTSVLAKFLYLHSYIVSESLFGGVLNNGWALTDIKAHPGKLHFDGTKKYNGRQLLQLSFDPKKSDSDMSIKLYFEPDTFRHVATVYQFSGQQVVALQAQKAEERVEENFSDFRDEDGLMLPHAWEIRYIGDFGNATNQKWQIAFPKILTRFK